MLGGQPLSLEILVRRSAPLPSYLRKNAPSFPPGSSRNRFQGRLDQTPILHYAFISNMPIREALHLDALRAVTR
jgi:hypothetical protein